MKFNSTEAVSCKLLQTVSMKNTWFDSCILLRSQITHFVLENPLLDFFFFLRSQGQSQNHGLKKKNQVQY